MEKCCKHLERGKKWEWKQMLSKLILEFGEKGNKFACLECKGESEEAVRLDQVYKQLQTEKEEISQEIKKLLNKMGSNIEQFRAVEEFKNMINRIQSEILTDFHLLITHTENLMQKQTEIKKNIESLKSELTTFNSIQQINSFHKYKSNLLNQIQFQINDSNLTILHGTEQLQYLYQKEMDKLNRKFLSLKDYSMKIIEVVLNTDEDDEDEEDCSLPIITKYYQRQRDYILKENKKNNSQNSSQNDVPNLKVERGETIRSKHHRTHEKEMQIKLRRMQDRFMGEIQQLSLQNKRLKQKIADLEVKVDKAENSQSSTVHSQKGEFGKVTNLFEGKGFHYRKNNR